VRPLPFREVLRAELARRCATNPRYSLRAFAQRLAIDHSSLSQIIRGKRPLSARLIRRLGASLRLGRERIEAFVSEEEQRRAPSRQSRLADDIARVARDARLVMTEWRHRAILELTRQEYFRADTRWIAQMLGITADEVNVALQRLLRLGMLEMRSATEWVVMPNHEGETGDAFAERALSRIAASLDSLRVQMESP
jgi:uncharacterized protein (TIGR02147 family)